MIILWFWSGQYEQGGALFRGHVSPASPLQGSDGTLDGCVFLTEEQADLLLDAFTAPEAAQPRRFLDLERRLHQKWTRMPIKYKFNGDHSEYHRVQG